MDDPDRLERPPACHQPGEITYGIDFPDTIPAINPVLKGLYVACMIWVLVLAVVGLCALIVRVLS
jgi:hypothetical protein